MTEPPRPLAATGSSPGSSPGSSLGPVPSQERLDAVRAAEHPACFLCSPDAPSGLRLRFRVQPDGSVVAFFPCRELFQSYPGTLHGGIVAALLDTAMANALFAIGVVAVTAELDVRYRAPVALERGVVVRGLVEKTTSHPLYYARAEVEQDRKVVARASARFLVKDAL